MVAARQRRHGDDGEGGDEELRNKINTAQHYSQHETSLFTSVCCAVRSACSLEDVKLVLYKWFSCYDTKPSESRLVSSPENKLETVLIMLRERHGIAVLLLYGWFGINWEDMCVWCMEWRRRRRRCNTRRRSWVITDGEWWIWKIFKDERAEHRKAIFHFLVKHFFFIFLCGGDSLALGGMNNKQTFIFAQTKLLSEKKRQHKRPTVRWKVSFHSLCSGLCCDEIKK